MAGNNTFRKLSLTHKRESRKEKTLPWQIDIGQIGSVAGRWLQLGDIEPANGWR
jgi:hypothetical protein